MSIGRRSGYLLVGTGLALALAALVLGFIVQPAPRGTEDPGSHATSEQLDDTSEPAAMFSVASTPQPGTPRSWEAGVQVGTYSVANLHHGNLLTAIPILGWSGRGPGMAINLYHNSATVEEVTLDLTRAMGFDLGEGWTTSYSAQIIGDCSTPTTATIIADDGTRSVYTWVSSAWEPPDGVYDVLDCDTNGWTITSKDQTVITFDTAGLLSKITDSSDNSLTVTRDALNNDRITTITDASGRDVDFNYDINDFLISIVDPTQDTFYVPTRTWDLAYEPSGRLDTVTLVMDRSYVNTFDYDSDGRLNSVSDAEGRAYSYTYFASSGPKIAIPNAIKKVTDPPPSNGPALYQSFSYFDNAITGERVTSLKDRRSNTWAYRFNTDGELAESTAPGVNSRDYFYDASHNLTQFRDESDNTWDFAYDATGNRTQATDPLSHVSAWTYDSFNNVTSSTDAELNVTLFNYAPTNDRTQLISVVEPDTGSGTATTSLTYFTASDDPNWHGLLWTVTDANSVTTEFDYDEWGQSSGERQGKIVQAFWPRVQPADFVQVYEKDEIGRVTRACSGGTCGTMGYGAAIPDPSLTGRAACSSGGPFLTCIACEPWQDCPGDPDCGTLTAAPTGPTQAVIDPGSLPPGWPTIPDCGDYPLANSGSNITYTAVGEPVDVTITDMDGQDRVIAFREASGNGIAYDEFGRPERMTITSAGEWGTGVVRSVDYGYGDASGIYTRTDQDGVVTTVVFDSANRVTSVTAVNGLDEMEVTYTYYQTGRVQYATYSNGTRTLYEYDAAGRLTHMRHELADASAYFKDIQYTYRNNDWLQQIYEETPPAGFGFGPTTEDWYLTDFTYDARGRLINETRTGDVGLGGSLWVYDIDYTYDQGGNRTSKVKNFPGGTSETTTYLYDVEDSATYGSHMNRLMSYEIFNSQSDRTERIWYVYNQAGDAMRIVRKFDDDDTVSATRLVYNKGNQVEYVIGETWEADPVVWYEQSSFEYGLTPDAMSWADAWAYALSRGGDLTHYDLSPIGPFLSTTFRPSVGTVRYWTGAQQDVAGVEPDQGWTWSNGTPTFLSAFWLAGEPDDGGCPSSCMDHDAGELVIDDDTSTTDDMLNDEDATQLRQGIIRRPVAASCDTAQDTLLAYARTFAWQFRYESARGRYMRRQLDPDTLAEITTEWSDYSGGSFAWTDFTSDIDSGVGTDTTVRNYGPGSGHADVSTNGWDHTVTYHGNQIGSSELLSDETSNITRQWAYTSFGEPKSLGGNENTRYRYAGASGYQSHDDFPLMHIGARWYDPETGRFLQRDPIGIIGGVNVYSYVRSHPASLIDPAGAIPEWGTDHLIIWTADQGRPYDPGPAGYAGTVVGLGQFGALSAVGTGAAAAAGAAAVAVARWLNRGKFRIGLSRTKGCVYFSIRWKQKHFDLFKVR